jgi:hypothetical protein
MIAPVSAVLQWRGQSVVSRGHAVGLAPGLGRIPASHPGGASTGDVMVACLVVDLMPLGYNGKVWWVRARVVSEIGAGLALDTVTDRIGRGGLHIIVERQRDP